MDGFGSGIAIGGIAGIILASVWMDESAKFDQKILQKMAVESNLGEYRMVGEAPNIEVKFFWIGQAEKFNEL
jgi:hypothetical protein